MEELNFNELFFNYQFELEDGTNQSFKIELNPDNLSIIDRHQNKSPNWTLLEQNQCPNCPLSTETHKYCPVAQNMDDITSFFSGLFSYEVAKVTITTPDRTYVKSVAIQDALSSLMGIVMVTSGCPVMDKLRPMVRNHLPFATIRENLYRVISMYFMAQYMRKRNGLEPDWSLDGLDLIYEEIKVVNQAFCERMGRLFEKDANLNAIVILNCLAEFASISNKQGMLDDYEEIFGAYLD